MDTIAFLGMGAMGERMARRLLDAGHALRIYNRSAARTAPLVAAGASAFATPREAASGADVVIAMVTDDQASRTVWLAPESGAASGLAPEAIAIECSTLTPGWIHELGAAVPRLLDAPLLGSRPQAEAGALAFLVGGEGELLERARPLLSLMGGAIHHVGARGTGAMLKLAVNALFGVQVAALGELLGALARAGLDPAHTVEILGTLPVTSPAVRAAAGLVIAGRDAPLFPIDLVAKDFRYAVAMAAGRGAELPVSAAAGEQFERARAAGLGDRNIHAVARLFNG